MDSYVPKPTFRIGVDTGGTFTDVIGLRDGEIVSWKLPSTPSAFEEAVLEGALQVSKGEVAHLLHSSTVATNALLERKGARCALVTTKGFRDVLEIGRQNRPDLYALCPVLPKPIIPRERRFELTERVTAEAEIEVPLDELEIPSFIRQLREAQVESVAVVFLFSFLRPEHERRVGDLLRAEGFSVSLSHEILPEFREYERSSTTAINAYVQPAMSRYLGRLETQAGEQKISRLEILQSNGGTLSPREAGEKAVNTLLSGPAAGLQGALCVAKASDAVSELNLITFDMGGTSTDVSLLYGEIGISTECKLENFPVGVPMVDVHTVGAGGGSIAKVDSGGALQVGPASASAVPGPAAYGKGGPATVTDAHVVLRNIRAENFLQGRMKLDRDASRAVMRPLAEEMGEDSIEDAAQGILRLVNLHMENAIRVISVQRGFDPADFMLMGFGGAGGLHVFALAEALKISRVMVPCHPGVLSALGAATASSRQEISRTVMVLNNQDGLGLVKKNLPELQDQLLARMDQKESLHFLFFLDMRYQGQSHELRVPLDSEDIFRVSESFRRLHKTRYGHAEEDAPLEIVNIRVQGERKAPSFILPELATRAQHENVPTPVDGVILRPELKRGDVVRGPLLILEDFHSVVLPQGWEIRPDNIGNLIGTRVEEASK